MVNTKEWKKMDMCFFFVDKGTEKKDRREKKKIARNNQG